jgi:ketosteroid isomerase-like protein
MGNEAVIRRFYSAFQKLDYKTMQDCYSDDPIFFDTVFGLLKGEEVKAMWEMLCKNARDFKLEFTTIDLLDHEYATCDWTASYTFSKTGRRVVNKVKAHMKFKDNKIVEHSDAFRLSDWAAQAYGFIGTLFGWTGFMKRAIRNKARKNLNSFMKERANS